MEKLLRRASLISKVVDPKNSQLILKKIFEKLASEQILHEFLNRDNIQIDNTSNLIFINNNRIPLRYSGFRNLLISYGFFIKDEIIKFNFFIAHEYQEWFCNYVIPNIESAYINKNSLDKLKKQKEKQENAGKQAEKFVLKYEKRIRTKHRKVGNIRIISEVDTSAGYDILSYSSDNSLLLDKFIEVKSYVRSQYFYWSANEMKVAKKEGQKYYIYLVDRDKMSDAEYHPIQIPNPAETLFNNPDWNYRDDGFFFEHEKF